MLQRKCSACIIWRLILLARSVSDEDILVILDAENERNIRYCDYRYAQVSASSLQSINSKAWPSKARSLIFKTGGTELEHVSEVLSVNKYLRVLDLSECSVNEIPAPVFQLKQLRYLDASNLSITTLPPQISNFTKLQTLDLSETEIMELPSFVSNLKGLNYLNLQGCLKLQELNSLDLLHDLHYLNLPCFLNVPNSRNSSQSFGQLAYLKALNLSSCPDLKILGSFESLTSLQILNLSNCSSLEYLPLCLRKLQNLDVSGCQDCIVQFCSQSSRSSPSHQLLEQAEQVRLSCDVSEIIPEKPAAIGNLKRKKKLASHVDKEPEVITKTNEDGDIVQGIPRQRSLLSSSYSYTFASSSSAPLASVSSLDISKMEHPMSNGETTGIRSNEECQEPQGFVEDLLITEESMCSLDTLVHLHEAAIVGGSDGNHISGCNGASQCNIPCDGH